MITYYLSCIGKQGKGAESYWVLNLNIWEDVIFMITYLVIFLMLIGLELAYFTIADHFNIIDKPNERSSHTAVVPVVFESKMKNKQYELLHNIL